MKKPTKSGSTKPPREAPWTVRGVSPEAKNAARLSARKEGKTIGEWVDRAIWEAAKSDKQQLPSQTLEKTLEALTEALERQNNRLTKIETKSWLQRFLRI